MIPSFLVPTSESTKTPDTQAHGWFVAFQKTLNYADTPEMHPLYSALFKASKGELHFKGFHFEVNFEVLIHH